jgi:hypothetical protein
VSIRIDVHHHHTVEVLSGDSRLDQILLGVVNLEKHMAAQDEKIDAFKAATDKKLAALGVAIDNISADEAEILRKLTEINANQDLTPENQAKLDAVLASLDSAVTKSQALADSLPDVVVP